MNLYFYVSKIITPLLLPTNFLFFLLILFVYLIVWKNKNRFKKIFCIFFVIFSSISLLPIGKGLIGHLLEKEYRNNQLPNNIDYIFVPSGDLTRVVQAIKIKNYYSPNKVKIVYSSGNAYLDPTNRKDFESVLDRAMLMNSNIDKKDIIILTNARNTIENFKQLKIFLSKNKNKKILLVTSAFHIKRSLVIAEKNGIKMQGYPSSYVASHDSFSFINFYQDINVQKNLYYFNIFFKEIVGIFLAKVML
jgi:uncharacterized SAM-binding protein YcdF (DUF218 family)